MKNMSKKTKQSEHSYFNLRAGGIEEEYRSIIPQI